MSRKVYLELTVKVVATVDEGVELNDFMDDIASCIQYFDSSPLNRHMGFIEDAEIVNWEVKDSK